MIKDLLRRSQHRVIATLISYIQQIGKGDFRPNFVAVTRDSDSTLVPLIDALEEMRKNLSSTYHNLTLRGAEYETLLSSMQQGVIAVDAEERIIKLNSAAARFLNLTDMHARGRSIVEAFHHAGLERFVRAVLKSNSFSETELVFVMQEREFIVQASAQPLALDNSGKRGAVVVLHDISRLKRLEELRKEFVSNVSHELKTPITSIKGSVETLLDGAYRNPADALKFLEMIARHTDRLDKLIESILSLARLESEAKVDAHNFEEFKIDDIFQSVQQICRDRALARGIQLELTCPPELMLQADRMLVEQALVNLVNNAIDYSDPRGVIQLLAISEDDEIILSVKDNGIGIESKHLPRIFERFYRVDQARDRKSGGTGLGLAIVKHICQVHGGYPSVESVPGKGSTFKIHMPRHYF
ncbi:PAS domain-containing protein [bacterium]|nr:PAS domain-containing protein [bacterium]